MLPYQPLDSNERELLSGAVNDHGRFIDKLEYYGDEFNYNTMQHLKSHQNPIVNLSRWIYELVAVLSNFPLALDQILSLVTTPMTPILDSLLYIVTLGQYKEERRASIKNNPRFAFDVDVVPTSPIEQEIQRLKTEAHGRGLTYLKFLKDTLVVVPLTEPLPSKWHQILGAFGSRGLRILGAMVILPLVVLKQAVDLTLTNVICLPLMAFGRFVCFGLSHLFRFPLRTVDFFRPKKSEAVVVVDDDSRNCFSAILNSLNGKKKQPEAKLSEPASESAFVAQVIHHQSQIKNVFSSNTSMLNGGQNQLESNSLKM